jgi:hypothetical protein
MNNTNFGYRTLSLVERAEHRYWPEFHNGGFLTDIFGVAYECLERKDKPHSIAAILLYQQLLEEMLLLVDYWCYFQKALALYPTTYEYDASDRLMFGQILKRIKAAQDFPQKAEFIGYASKINEASRVPVAHRILQGDTWKDVVLLAIDARDAFEEVRELFDDIQTSFFSEFDRLAEKAGIPDKRQA